MRISNLLIAPLFVLSAASAHADIFTFDARNVQLQDNHVWCDKKTQYPGITGRSSTSVKRKFRNMTECRDDENRPVSCEMLLDVTFIDHAQITVENGAVRRIRVIELLQ